MKERDPESPDVQAAEPAAPATPALEERLKKLEEEKEALFAQLVRRQADFENFRKRVEREQQEHRQYAEAELVGGILPVLDGFERSLAAAGEVDPEYRKGVELIHKQLLDTLTRFGLQPVPALGKTFDPFHHHAVERVESADHADQEIIAELQRGYYYKERLVRPALVRVAVRPGKSGEAKS